MESTSTQLYEENSPQNRQFIISETRKHFHSAHTLLLGRVSSPTVKDQNIESFPLCLQELCNGETHSNLNNLDVNVHSEERELTPEMNTLDFAVNILGVTPDFTIPDQNVFEKETTHFDHPVDESQDLFQEPDRDNDTPGTILDIVSRSPCPAHCQELCLEESGCSNSRSISPSNHQYIVVNEDLLCHEQVPVMSDDETLDPNYFPSDADGEERNVGDVDRSNDSSLQDGQRVWDSDEASLPAETTALDASSLIQEGEAHDTQPGRPTTRKRVRQETDWKTNVRKRRRNHGEEYLTRKGKMVRNKSLEDKQCGCSKQCNTSITFDTRQEIFSNFWKLGEWSAQNDYLVGLIKVNEIKQRDNRDRRGRAGVEGPILPKKTQRKSTREYNLQNSSGVTTVVCKKFFIDTFKISNGRLDRAVQTAGANKGPTTDQRGRKEPQNKTPTHVIEELQTFITAFPKYESHYCRENGQYGSTGRLYFAPGLNIAKLYAFYVEDCEMNSRRSVSEQVFRKVLKKDFRLSFHSPLKDTCKTCDAYKVKIATAVSSNDHDKANELRKEKEEHHDRAEEVRKEIKKDKEKPNMKVICFDLQKTLPTPVLTTSIVYYKRQLWTYNLGIHDEQTGNACMYMWHEGNGSRGPNEIGSCLLKYIKENEVPENLTAYTDTCGGQNRNIKICLFWLHVVNDESNNIEIVDQKFFVPGHSYMSCDRDFGIIEQHKHHHPYVFLPEDWMKLVKNASNKFTVGDMTSDDIVHVELLLKSIVHRKSDVNGEKVEWLKIQWLRFRKDSPLKIFFKYTLSEEVPFRCLCIAKRTRREGRQSFTPSDPLPQLYPNGHAIKSAKFNDLKSLFPFIPPVYHAFYNSLLHNGDIIPCNDDGGDDVVEMEVDEA